MLHRFVFQGMCASTYFLTDVYSNFMCVTHGCMMKITGYYARVTSVHSLLKQFVTLTRMAGLKSQVISLGAGYDTTFWQLHSVGLQPTCYFEVDLATVTCRKCHYIRYTYCPLCYVQYYSNCVITTV